MRRDAILLILAQNAALGIFYTRFPSVAQLFSTYYKTILMSLVVIGVVFLIGNFNREKIYHVKGGSTVVMRYPHRDESRQLALLKAEFDELHAKHSLLKTDFEQAHQERTTLVQKHMAALSVSQNLTFKIHLLADELIVKRSDIQNANKAMRHLLTLILRLRQYVLLAGKRIRFLSASLAAKQEKMSTLLIVHLALRSRYVDATDKCTELRATVKDLDACLDLEASKYQTLREDHERDLLDIQKAKKDCLFYQALAWTVVTRYDRLQTDYGQLLTTTDRLKRDYSGLHEYLREAASIAQETQDVADLGLADLQQPMALRPLRVKQNLMKICQGLALVRLNVTELLDQVELTINREAGKTVVVSSFSSPCVPGSVEDAIRKLKIVYQASEESSGDLNDELVQDSYEEGMPPSIRPEDSSDSPAGGTMRSLKDIISMIDAGDFREELMNDLTSASGIAEKIQELMNESKDAMGNEDSVENILSNYHSS